jgi:hypothetical protein
MIPQEFASSSHWRPRRAQFKRIDHGRWPPRVERHSVGLERPLGPDLPRLSLTHAKSVAKLPGYLLRLAISVRTFVAIAKNAHPEDATMQAEASIAPFGHDVRQIGRGQFKQRRLWPQLHHCYFRIHVH